MFQSVISSWLNKITAFLSGKWVFLESCYSCYFLLGLIQLSIWIHIQKMSTADEWLDFSCLECNGPQRNLLFFFLFYVPRLTPAIILPKEPSQNHSDVLVLLPSNLLHFFLTPSGHFWFTNIFNSNQTIVSPHIHINISGENFLCSLKNLLLCLCPRDLHRWCLLLVQSLLHRGTHCCTA